MSAGKSRGAWVVGGLMATVFCLVMAQTEAYSAQGSQPTQTKNSRQAPFTLTIECNFISLTARNASVKAILEELGRRMNLAVVAAIPTQETITTEFPSLPLKLSVNHGACQSQARPMTKIVIMSGVKGVSTSASATNKLTRDLTPSQPEPFCI